MKICIVILITNFQVLREICVVDETIKIIKAKERYV